MNISLVWDAITKDTENRPLSGVVYNVYRSTNADGSSPEKLGAAVTGLAFVDVIPTPIVPFYYFVRGLKDGKEGANSNIFKLDVAVPVIPGTTTIRVTVTVGP